MKFPPMLFICGALIAGIAVGARIATPLFLSSHGISVSTVCGFCVLALLLLSIILRTYEHAATALLLAATFTLGAFLVKSEQHDGSLPYEEEITQYMTEKRSEFTATYRQSGITGDEYGVVTAMTLGDRQHISKALRNQYNVSGASHVFALSGMHLGIIYMLLILLTPQWLLLRFRRLRRVAPLIAAALQIFTLWAYVMLVGCHPSIIRAAVMLTIYTLSRQMSQRPDSLSILAFTLALLLVIWPQWLFEVGFQMSFLAVASIVTLYIPLSNKLLSTMPRHWYTPPVRLLLQTMLLSTCAQIGVAPLIAFYFHHFSTYFLLTNIPVPLLATIIIYLAALLLCLTAMHLNWLAIAVATTLNWTTSLLNRYIQWIASLPHASIEDINLSAAQTVIIYVVIICLCLIAYHLHHGIRRRLGDV